MENFKVYRDIQLRTGGDIYIGVVGPVRTGKSTFIRRFMEQIAIPLMEENLQKEIRDQLPVSGSGKTITTCEPKFIPKEAVKIMLGEKQEVNVRLIDCVGFLVKEAAGHVEDGKERMVKTPWIEHPIPFQEAAKLGTEKVISERFGEENVEELSLEDKDDFLDGFAALNIGEWRSNYDTERFGYYVMDGTQWELEIHYSNGNKTKSYYGSNAYPYNFNKLLELVEYDYEYNEEDDDVRLNYTIDLDDKNDLLKQMYEKVKELPFGTEISTSDLLSMISKNSSYIDGKYIYDDLALEMKDMFSIDLEFKETAADHGIEIDDTIHDGEVLGMPFHIGFIIKSY